MIPIQFYNTNPGTALDQPNLDGSPRHTTALMDPDWDRFYTLVSQREGKGGGPLSLGGQVGQTDPTIGSVADPAADDYNPSLAALARFKNHGF
jgi:hypothetical protein